MFHFSTDRLAGLDTMILKITTPKVPTLIPNHTVHHDTYVPVRKLKKQKPQRETRPPLADKTASNNLAPRPPHPTSSMFLHALSTAGEVKFLRPNDSSSPRVPCSPDIPSFRPLPPLPSASTLQLPSFFSLSTQSFASVVDQPPRQSIASLPPSVLFRVSSSPVASSRHVVARKIKTNKVFEGPQWIPAFHHPNSPYVPWPSPVRRRILPPPSPLPPSPVCLSSPCIRSGAVAPEPWASSIFSQAPKKSGKERLSSSWKSFKNSIKMGLKAVVFRLGKSRKSPRRLCISQDMLRTYDDTDTTAIVPDSTSNAMRSALAKTHIRGSCDSLASFVSSDSRTLAAWLAERRATASCIIDGAPREMSVEEYELKGSWLDFRHCDEGWGCGVQDCDMHTAGGSPHGASKYSDVLRTAMPFDSAGLLSATHRSPTAPALLFPPGPYSTPPRFHSLPRLPCQSFDIHSTQEAKRATSKDAGRCLTRCRELSMPGGWTFN
ncbi:hypothetical protein J3R82DRAFT_968 [Butyriboletus roseoflavus]|nr:hypothetical protein J3R82DRAFT_968 [Butyriboletus roseoflavus]